MELLPTGEERSRQAPTPSRHLLQGTAARCSGRACGSRLAARPRP